MIINQNWKENLILTDGVDVGAKELGRLAPELEESDTAGTLGVGEDLNKVG